jgi:hypothetical protein
MKRLIYGALASISSLLMAVALPLAAKAATTVVVTPTNDDGWSSSQSTAGGNVQYVYDPSSPMPSGALQLVTDSTTTSKASYLHTANTQLSNVTTLSYSTRQLAASSPTGDPSYQLVTCLGGTANSICTGFTTLVYEPYQQTNAATVTAGDWQTWSNVADGQFWSSRTYTDNANCSVTAGAGGAPFYTLSDLQTNCPNAIVVSFGVNVGSNNPSYVTEVDGVVFNDFTYDFQLTNTPANKDACKDNGFQSLTDENGNAFKNQGQCVSYTNLGGQVLHLTTSSVQAKNVNNGVSALFTKNSQTSNSGSNANNNSNANTNTGSY